MNILIRNAEILTVEDGSSTIYGNLGIMDNLIAFIGETPDDFIPDEVIDADGNLLMPGFTNAHTHIPMSLFRSYADDLPFFPWLTEKIFPAEAKLRAEDVYVGSMVTIAEMIRFGVTSFEDMYFFMDEILKSVHETGIRANIGRGIVTSGSTLEEVKLKIDEVFDFKKKYDNHSNSRIKVDIAPHAPYTNTTEYMKLIIERAKKEDARIHIHLSESRQEVEDSFKLHGKSPIQYVNDLGLFELPTMAAHCVHLDDNDMKIIAAGNVSIIHNPVSNMKLGNGAARIYELQNLGVNIALGTDGSASNNNQNVLEEAKLAAILAKGTTTITTAVPAYEALKMSTINGAKAMGLGDEIGTLKVGKKADMIIISTKGPHWWPKFDTVSNLIYSGQALDVITTIVDGKILMKNKELLTIDLEKITKLAQESAEFLTQ